jgi:hypothetical protein
LETTPTQNQTKNKISTKQNKNKNKRAIKQNKIQSRGEIRLSFTMKNKQEANTRLFGSPLDLNLTVGNTYFEIPPIVETIIHEIEERGLKTEGK